MNRGYTRARYLELVDALRDAEPEIALSTDVIVGFPGETEGDFEETLAMVERVGYDNVFAFRYSARPGTPTPSGPRSGSVTGPVGGRSGRSRPGAATGR